jgi:glycerophosphoryl diester phosphodiesterase
MRPEIRPFRRLALTAVVLVGSWIAATAVPAGVSLDVQGHRGWRGQYPENTMAAFRGALELGVTTLELDVQVTRDGVPVVHHDAKLNRSLCVRDDGSSVESKRFDQLEFAELADIDCGSRPNEKFPEQRRVPGERIPRLTQVLDLAGEANYPVRFSVEIKMQGSTSADAATKLAGIVVETIRAHELEERTIVQSFQPEALAAVAELAPEIERAVLVRSAGAYDRAVERAKATILSPRHDGLTRAAVERFQQRGISVIPWTVNKTSAIEKVISWGVDGIISDYPDRVLQALEQPAEEAP